MGQELDLARVPPSKTSHEAFRMQRRDNNDTNSHSNPSFEAFALPQRPGAPTECCRQPLTARCKWSRLWSAVGRRPAQAQQLVALAEGAELFHDPEG